ncbi:hypothetical protein [Brevibacillus sp. SKDU10]|uniref:hypothetical protein n=1 Tax=Brevibacillus sp. SKDU10 TaxID=1247872 RepID=UPI0012F98F11|nr:hypothetical protein [Brevibacillus sp. SKDU10]
MVCLGMLAVIVGVMAFFTLINGELIGITFLLISAILGNLTGFAMVDYATPRYEVTITDMSRFDTDKYQIVEQRGKVFVVKEVRR